MNIVLDYSIIDISMRLETILTMYEHTKIGKKTTFQVKYQIHIYILLPYALT